MKVYILLFLLLSSFGCRILSSNQSKRNQQQRRLFLDRSLDTRLVQQDPEKTQKYSDIYDHHQNLYSKIKENPLRPIESTKEPSEVSPLKQQAINTINSTVSTKSKLPTTQEKAEDNLEMLKTQLLSLYEQNKDQKQIYLPPEALETMKSFLQHKEYVEQLKEGQSPDQISKPKLPHHLDPNYTGQPTTEELLGQQRQQLKDFEEQRQKAKENLEEFEEAQLTDQIKAIKEYISQLENRQKQEQDEYTNIKEEDKKEFENDIREEQQNQMMAEEDQGNDVLDEEQIRDKRIHDLQEDLYEVEQKIKTARENDNQGELEPLLEQQEKIGDAIEKLDNGTLLEEEAHELKTEVQEIESAEKELEKDPENAQTVIELEHEKKQLIEEEDEAENVEEQLDEIDQIKQRIQELEKQYIDYEKDGHQNVEMIQIKGEIDALIQRKHQIESQKAGIIDPKKKILGWAEAGQKDKEVFDYPEEEIKLLLINNIGKAKSAFGDDQEITITKIDKLKDIAINIQIAFQMIFRDIQDIDFNSNTPYHEEEYLEDGMKILAHTRTFIISQDINKTKIRRDVNFLSLQIDQLEKKKLGFLKFYNFQDVYENSLKEGQQNESSILQLEKELSQMGDKHNEKAKECEDLLQDTISKNMEIYNETEELRRTMDYDSLDPIEKVKSAVKLFPQIEQNRNIINDNLSKIIQNLEEFKLMQKDVLKILQDYSQSSDKEKDQLKGANILKLLLTAFLFLFQIIQQKFQLRFSKFMFQIIKYQQMCNTCGKSYQQSFQYYIQYY